MSEINVVGTTNLEVTPESEQIQVGNFSGDPTVGKVQPSTDDYDNIPIPGELLGEQSKQESNTEQAVTTESVEPAKTEEPNEPQQELSDSEEETSYYETEDGEQFTVEDIESWKKDADNRHEWSKSNTEKAQEIADQRRAVEPLVQLVGQLNKSEEFRDTLKEAIEDELGEEAGQLFEQSLKMENKDLPNPFESELAEAKEKLEMMEAEKVLDQSMSDLQAQYSLKSEQVQEVLDYAINAHEETGRLLTLEEAYKVMSFDKPKVETPIKAKPSVPVNVQKKVGVKSDKQSKITNYEDIDVATFFNQ